MMFLVVGCGFLCVGRAFHDADLLRRLGAIALVVERHSATGHPNSGVSSVQLDFHARYSACSKKYQYRSYVSPVMDPLQHGCVYHIRNPVDVATMQEAASHLLGLHNFSAFANHSADTVFRGDFREIVRFSVLSTVCTSSCTALNYDDFNLLLQS